MLDKEKFEGERGGSGRTPSNCPRMPKGGNGRRDGKQNDEKKNRTPPWETTCRCCRTQSRQGLHSFFKISTREGRLIEQSEVEEMDS